MITLKDYARQFARTYWLYLLGLAVVAVGSACFEILVEYKVKEIIDQITSAHTLHLGWFLGLFVVYKFLSHFVYFLMRVLNIIFDPKIIASTILAAYSHALQQSLHWFDSKMSGDLSAKITDFHEGVDTLIMSAFRLAIVVMTVGLGIAFLCLVNVTVAMVLAAFVVIYVPVIYLLMRRQIRLQQAFHEAKQTAAGVINDGVVNILSLKTIGTVSADLDRRFLPALKVWQEADLQRRRFDAYVVDNADTVMIVLMSGVQIYLLATYYEQGLITAGGFAFVAMLTLKIHGQLNNLLDTLLFSVNPSLAKIRSAYETLFAAPDVQDHPQAKVLTKVHGAIDFDAVLFQYPSRKTPVLDHFSLHIQPGERIGVVGESGAGKTTLIKCLLRYFDVQSGRVSIDGHAITDVTQASLREHIAVIPQDITMLHCSIRENLALARPDATMEEMEEACRHANIHDAIMAMPDQYETIVGERGVKISGGQRQRIAIARAVLKRAPIVILDEATSSLDTPTEQLIQRAIEDILQDSQATVIAIAHRLSTLKHMDRIVVLDQGRLVEMGTHDDLMAKPHGHYKRLWDLQLV